MAKAVATIVSVRVTNSLLYNGIWELTARHNGRGAFKQQQHTSRFIFYNARLDRWVISNTVSDQAAINASTTDLDSDWYSHNPIDDDTFDVSRMGDDDVRVTGSSNRLLNGLYRAVGPSVYCKDGESLPLYIRWMLAFGQWIIAHSRDGMFPNYAQSAGGTIDGRWHMVGPTNRAHFKMEPITQ